MTDKIENIATPNKYIPTVGEFFESLERDRILRGVSIEHFNDFELVFKFYDGVARMESNSYIVETNVLQQQINVTVINYKIDS